MADALTVDRVDKAYMGPIRTVLAVDDEFHQYGSDKQGATHLRAKALWQACRNRGLLCDVDDGADLVAGKPHPHLLKSDLVILDYHLKTPVPILEWFVVENMGEIKEGMFDAIEFSRSQPAPDAQHQFANKQVKMRVMGQIRALYASRIQQYAGQHLSRIGVDFVNLPQAPPPKEKAKAKQVPAS